MLKQGPAKKICIYVGEDQQYHGQALYAAILDYLFYRGVSGATVVRGIAGFGADHKMHTARILRLTENLPVKIEFVETPEKLDEILPKLHDMVGVGLIDVQDTTVLKPSQAREGDAPDEVLPASKRAGKAKLMRIFIGENDKWRDKPLYQALVESLRANDIAGVTVYHGILGYGANRRIHQQKAMTLSHDRPIMLSIVDSEEKLRAFTPILDDMVTQGLVVLSDVDIVKYTHAVPQPKSRIEGNEMKLEGKAKLLRIHFGESDEWHGKPLYRAIVEKCKELDIAGATVFRGIEGYGASTLIRRAHLLSFSSDAPVMVSVVDSEQKIKLLLPFLDEMLRDGLIATSDVEVVKYVHQGGARS